MTIGEFHSKEYLGFLFYSINIWPNNSTFNIHSCLDLKLTVYPIWFVFCLFWFEGPEAGFGGRLTLSGSPDFRSFLSVRWKDSKNWWWSWKWSFGDIIQQSVTVHLVKTILLLPRVSLCGLSHTTTICLRPLSVGSSWQPIVLMTMWLHFTSMFRWWWWWWGRNLDIGSHPCWHTVFWHTHEIVT
jgi:hypothetical protein